MDEASYLVFYETWYSLAEGRDTDAKRLAFYDTIFRYAFDGIEPQKPVRGESPGEAWAAWDAFVVAKAAIDNHRKKVSAGRAGGSAGKGISRNKGNQNAIKSKAKPKQNNSKTIANQKQNNSTSAVCYCSASDINKNKNKSNTLYSNNKLTGLNNKPIGLRESVTAREESQPQTADVAHSIGDLPPSDRPDTVPSNEELELMATQMSIPKEYVAEFIANIKDLGWGYVNRGGSFVALNRRNCKAILASFWYQRQKENSKTQPAKTIGVKIETTDDYEKRF